MGQTCKMIMWPNNITWLTSVTRILHFNYTFDFSFCKSSTNSQKLIKRNPLPPSIRLSKVIKDGLFTANGSIFFFAPAFVSFGALVTGFSPLPLQWTQIGWTCAKFCKMPVQYSIRWFEIHPWCVKSQKSLILSKYWREEFCSTLE